MYQLLYVLLIIFMVVCLWQVYCKAGEHGWAVLIPYYNIYVLFKVSGRKKLFWVWLVASIVLKVSCGGAFVAFLCSALNRVRVYKLFFYVLCAFIAAMVVCLIIMIVLYILQCKGIARSFGLGGGFTVGLIFLPFIFYAIIAFDSNIAYVGRGEDKTEIGKV